MELDPRKDGRALYLASVVALFVIGGALVSRLENHIGVLLGVIALLGAVSMVYPAVNAMARETDALKQAGVLKTPKQLAEQWFKKL